MSSITQIDAYQKESFTSRLRNGKVVTNTIYTQGSGSKVVIIIQELPGIGQETLALSDRFVNEGYTVVLPHLFGKIGKTATFANFGKVLFCMRRQFSALARNHSSPIVDFLSDLCTYTKEKHQVQGVAVIGMCLTGNFAISLMANQAVLAGFASQPSLPFKRRGIHMSPEEITQVKNRLDDIGPMHCARFKEDGMCPASRFDLYKKTFNTDRERIILHELPGDGHAILTLDFVDEEGHATKDALNDVITYFDSQLN
ncbi:dienelactone hydrolase family protein [uncultured Dokdonia sp.]|uniref:dienelactone hydrolase family protein n=1 Tax=uncultured Dokdonia sp. TaxID=575653 RepID=UPI00260208BC|nr:dienelactone hydrolase family protein [uncultured Dokdonia sp.]